ncbi:MAG TPA: choice-of-anchor Q domain-containing protein [Thermoanaerobaculia bacterium]|nr:choice-of-anchor Q domain-containing protein [Thermoanaerobaculia bacterium]
MPVFELGGKAMGSGSARRFAVGISFVISLCGLLAFGAASAASAAVYYVVPGGATSGTCGSWGSACTLQAALGVASSGDEVWVAAGVYYPSTTNTRTDTFLIPPGVAVYGGFQVGDTLLSQRDPAANVTVLSGDIDGNDTNTDGNNIDETHNDIQGSNSYHVVWMDGTSTAITQATVLDGFTITAGLSNDATSIVNDEGGGLYCDGKYGGNCSPTISNVTFSGNAAGRGGAICNEGLFGTSSPAFTNVTFNGNGAGSTGGAIFNDGHDGTSSPSFTNVTFNANYASLDGGAIDNDGFVGTSSPTLTNVTFSGNIAGFGGAIWNDGESGTSSPILTNVILWGDAATTGNEIYNSSASATLDHCVVPSCPSGATCTNSVTTDPLLGTLQNNGGSTETMALGAGSSAIDTGTNTGCPATDQRGVTRPQGPRCDIGAYEVIVPPVTAIPALSFQGLALLGLLLAAGALGLLRRG